MITASNFCVKAPRKDILYQGCWILCHNVVPEKAVAIFNEGLLQVSAPMAKLMKGTKVKIDTEEAFVH